MPVQRHFDRTAHGAARSAWPVQNWHEAERTAARLTAFDFDRRAAEYAAEIYADLGRCGELIGPYDMLYCCYARSQCLVVVTEI